MKTRQESRKSDFSGAVLALASTYDKIGKGHVLEKAKEAGLKKSEVQRAIKYIESIREARARGLSLSNRGHEIDYKINSGLFHRTARHNFTRQLFTVLWKPANHDITFTLGKELFVSYEKSRDGNYSGRFSGYAKYSYRIGVCVPFKNFASHEGIYFDHSDGVDMIVTKKRTAFGVTVLEGYTFSRKDLSLSSIFCVKHGDTAYHAASLKSAFCGLRRKEKKLLKIRSLSRDSLVTRTDYHNLTGACFAGIENFCHRHGLDGVKKIKAEDLLSILRPNDYGYSFFKSVVEKN